MSQLLNDTFPTVMHIAAMFEICNHSLPHLEELRDTNQTKNDEFSHIVKLGRTHLQDATPLTLELESSGRVQKVTHGIANLKDVSPG